MFAAKSGASRVSAVEGSIRVVKAAEVVKKNKLDLEFFVLKSDTLVDADYVFDEICDFKTFFCRTVSGRGRGGAAGQEFFRCSRRKVELRECWLWKAPL